MRLAVTVCHPSRLAGILLALLAAWSCGPATVRLPSDGAASPSDDPDQGAGSPRQGADAWEADLRDARSPDVTPDQAADQAHDQGADQAHDQGADQGVAPEASRVYTVAVISDLNGSYGSTTYSAEVHEGVSWLVNQLRPDLVISTGDMVAGQRAGVDHRAMWRAFHVAVTEPLAKAQIPFAPTPGNHDASGYAAFQHERTLYMEQWDARRPAVRFVEDTYYPLHYAFTLGPALWISLDDTMVGPLGGPQLSWLRQVLLAHPDKPIKIVYGHVPPHAFAQGREDEVLDDPALEQLLADFGVTMFISGHHHAYYPGRAGGLRVVSAACLGSGARRLIGDRATSPKSIIALHYSQEGILSLEAYTGPGFSTVVERHTLPTSIAHGRALIVRDDL